MTRIVLAGAGYGGVMAGKHLERENQRFLLINQYPYHQLITWLHEAATARHSVDEYQVPLMDVFRRSALSSIVIDDIQAIRRDAKKIFGRKGDYRYDVLLIALGSAPEFFGVPGLAEHSLQLRSLETARQIRTHIVRQFEAYNRDRDARRLTVVVGGAGLTGIEFVGELVEWLPNLCAKYNIEKSAFRVINLEAAPSILPALSSALQQRAKEILMTKGADIRTGMKIGRVEQDKVFLASNEVIEARTIVWTGGVRANPLLAQAGFTCDARGRAKVNYFLQSVDDPNIFIIGDCASFVAAGKPLPPTAQLATQMGSVAADNILAYVEGRQMLRFSPKIRGTLASLGRKIGIGEVGGVETSGAFASLAKEFTKVKYLFQLGGFRMVNRKEEVRERVLT